MKKLLVLTLVLASFVSYGQNKKEITSKLKNGIGQEVPITFIILGRDKLDSVLVNNVDKKIENAIFVANLELEYSMKNKLSYTPLQTSDNNIMYFKDNQIVVSLSCSGKNGYGNSIEKTYNICLVSDDYGDISKIKSKYIF